MSPIVSPLAANVKSSAPQNPDDYDCEDTYQRYVNHARSARRFFLGPMPVRTFLGFLPKMSMSRMPRPTGAFKDIPKKSHSKRNIYTHLIAALNGGGRKKSRCPGFIFRDTCTRDVDYGDIGSMHPEVCCYSQDCDRVTSRTDATLTGVLGHAEMHIEVKRDAGLDYFRDPAPHRNRSNHDFILSIDNIRTRRQAELLLGKNVACAIEALACQHRSFYFSISLFGSSARLIRWDRGGAIASEAFDLHDKPELLCEFLWRYAHASPADRGYDPTVELATSDEEDLFREAIERHVKLQLSLTNETDLADAVGEHYLPGAVTAISVVDETDRSTHRLLVSRPVVSPLTITGRSTRGYWAVTTDAPRGSVVFLKDTWRSELLNTKEGNILADLRDAGVPNIPQLVLHGDVQGATKGAEEPQSTALTRTRTHLYRQARWVCKAKHDKIHVFSHVHYRLLLGTVGYGLERFKGSRELLHATFDAYQAMLSAFSVEDEAKRRLHCDVSLGNIILVKEPGSDSTVRTGYLIDWEFSSFGGPRSAQYDASGSIRFMSHKLLSTRDPHRTIEDDMESLYYVVLYCSLRWLPHNQGAHLPTLLHDFFDDYWISPEGYVTGGSAKFANLHTRCHTGSIRFSTPAVQAWMDEVMEFIADHAFSRQTKSAEPWNEPESFLSFWDKFLGSWDMLDDDRLDREEPRMHHDQSILAYSSPSTPAMSYNADIASPVTAAAPTRKRKAEGELGADLRKVKRVRPPSRRNADIPRASSRVRKRP